jgi:hypothetical protein
MNVELICARVTSGHLFILPERNPVAIGKLEQEALVVYLLELQ